MKKYNLSEIMKRAWEIVRSAATTMSAALKQAWKEAKEMMEKKQFTGFAKVLKEERDYGDCCYLYFKKWEKYGKSRIYVNDYKNRTLGFIENGEFNLKDAQGNNDERINRAMDTFFATYAL